ncbi:hypothetical protein HBI79_141820 [Parastagonospora nodorum]|nr:hypothetical protein HBI79_141820 [Parastagonospora nodorum]
MLFRCSIVVVVFVGLEQCSTVSYYLLLSPSFLPLRRGCRVIGLSASGLIIKEKKGERKISEIYMPASTGMGLKYLFALLLAANVLLPRELDRCNYYVEEASKPTLRAAD